MAFSLFNFFSFDQIEVSPDVPLEQHSNLLPFHFKWYMWLILFIFTLWWQFLIFSKLKNAAKAIKLILVLPPILSLIFLPRFANPLFRSLSEPWSYILEALTYGLAVTQFQNALDIVNGYVADPDTLLKFGRFKDANSWVAGLFKPHSEVLKRLQKKQIKLNFLNGILKVMFTILLIYVNLYWPNLHDNYLLSSIWISFFFYGLFPGFVEISSALTGFSTGLMLVERDTFPLPFLSTSPRELWSRRWNRIFSGFVHRNVFIPVVYGRIPKVQPPRKSAEEIMLQVEKDKEKRELNYSKPMQNIIFDPKAKPQKNRIKWGVIASFAYSALYHEVFIWVNHGAYVGYMTMFFTIHCFACLFSELISKLNIFRMPKLFAIALHFLWFMLIAPLYFMPYAEIGAYSAFIRASYLRLN